MADPHRKDRYGETWNLERNKQMLAVIGLINPYVVISGGWAWHFLSEVGHTEYKHAHDHKDLDIFVAPEFVAGCVRVLKMSAFQKVATKYDALPSAEEFRRYECYHELPHPMKLTIDFFVNTPPTLEVPAPEMDTLFHAQGTKVKVVDPATLLTYYTKTNASHSSDKCWAVEAARKLLKDGEPVLHHPLLTQIPAGKSAPRR